MKELLEKLSRKGQRCLMCDKWEKIREFRGLPYGVPLAKLEE